MIQRSRFILINKKINEFYSLIQDDEKEWEPIDVILEKNNINYEKTLKLLSSITMEIAAFKEVDVAFTAFAKNKVLEGFCRYTKNETIKKVKTNKNNEDDEDDDEPEVGQNENEGIYEVTKEFELALDDYIRIPQLSFLLQMLQSQKLKNIGKIILNKILSPDEFSSSGQRWSEISQYLKEQPCKKFFLVDNTIDTISQTTLRKMESILLNEKENNDDDEDEVEVDIDENQDNLLWPGKPREFDQSCKVGSRVIVLMRSGSIPFGELGTVVAIDWKNLLFSVMLDNEFPFACNLRKRLETNRGLVAKIDDLFFIQ